MRIKLNDFILVKELKGKILGPYRITKLDTSLVSTSEGGNWFIWEIEKVITKKENPEYWL